MTNHTSPYTKLLQHPKQLNAIAKAVYAQLAANHTQQLKTRQTATLSAKNSEHEQVSRHHIHIKKAPK
jgi:hypothetical protein